MEILRTKAIVLRYRDVGESGRMVALYSKDFGKLTALARGSRKITSKLAPILEPVVYGDYMIVRGRKNDILASGVLINGFRRLRQDYKSCIAALIILKTVDELSVEGEAENNFFDQLYGRLHSFETHAGALSIDGLQNLIDDFRRILVFKGGFAGVNEAEEDILYNEKVSNYL